jgi:hypothetical protein
MLLAMIANDAPSAPGEPIAHRSRNPTVGWRVMAEDLDPESLLIKGGGIG